MKTPEKAFYGRIDGKYEGGDCLHLSESNLASFCTKIQKYAKLGQSFENLNVKFRLLASLKLTAKVLKIGRERIQTINFQGIC